MTKSICKNALAVLSNVYLYQKRKEKKHTQNAQLTDRGRPEEVLL